MLEQAARYELLSCLHHVLPHLKGLTLLIQKRERLLPAHGTVLLAPQSYQMRKRDFSDHAFSVFLVAHCLEPPLVYYSSGHPWSRPRNPTSANGKASALPTMELCY